MAKKLDEGQTNSELNPDLKKDLQKAQDFPFKDLRDQVRVEYELGWWYMKPKIDEWATRLKIYNNQKRDKMAIGDPLLFTIHQTVLASLYNDRLSVQFMGREEGDDETAENLNNLADFDYDEMEKDILDYEWDWDASFFGRGLLLASEFDRKLKCPTPEIIDVMTWLRDPRATSVNGDRKGRGSMRFGGREICLSKSQIGQMGIYKNYEGLKPNLTDIQSLFDKNAQARMEAQGLSDVTKWKSLQGASADYRLLEWFTTYNGKKVLVTLGDNMRVVVRYTELPGNIWPIIDRTIYPISHDWDGVSIPDLAEDKQRARATLQNLALDGVRIGLQPTYLFNTNKIKNRGSLNVDFNKHIPVDGDPNNAIVQVNKQVVKQEVQWILDVLDTAAQRATATPDIQQGIQSEEKRTATELNLQSAKVDTRYSLSAKIFGWSEKRFWQQWYKLYKDNFESDIDEKVIRISGAMGSRWKKLTRPNIIAHVDPDVKVESRIISEALKINQLQKYRLWVKDILATDPKSANIRFALEKEGKLSGLSQEEIDQVLPPTIDELNADDENEMLDKDELVNVKIADDDFVHMEVHNKAADTSAKYAHIKAHKKAMMLKRVRPEFDLAKNRPEDVQPEANTTGAGVFQQAGGSVTPVMNNQQTV